MSGKVNKQVIEEASNWFVDFRVGDTDASRAKEFHEWLRRSPDHIQAYLDIAMAYAELSPPSPTGEIDFQALVDYARSTEENNIVPLALPASGLPAAKVQSGMSPRASGPRTRALAMAASFLLAITLALGSWFYMERGTYSTGIGEQRSLILADGSTVELNARSRIRVRYLDDERRIDLIEGQALFQVAKNAHRPFIVRVNDTQVRAVGTQFDVYRKDTGTVVTVVEGKVSVDVAASAEVPSPRPLPEEVLRQAPPTAPLRVTAEGRRGEVFLAAGEQLIIRHEAVIKPQAVNPATTTAWTRRQLIFEDASLPEVAEEFNRYSARPIIVEAGAIDSFHVSGTYSSANQESLLRFLRAQPGIKVIETDAEIRIARD